MKFGIFAALYLGSCLSTRAETSVMSFYGSKYPNDSGFDRHLAYFDF